LITHLLAPPTVGTGAGRQGFQNTIAAILGLLRECFHNLLDMIVKIS